MIPVVHFSKSAGISEVRSGTFFAENPDSVPVLRAGLGSYGKGYVYEAEIDPISAMDLLDWELSGKLVWGSKILRAEIIRIINSARHKDHKRPVTEIQKQKQYLLDSYTVIDAFRVVWHSLDMGTDDDIVSGVWDMCFDYSGAIKEIVKVAKKYQIASLCYDTQKDKAERVWIAIDPTVVSNLRLAKKYAEYTEAELDELGTGRHPG